MWRHMRRNQISSFWRKIRVHLNRRGGGVCSVDCWQPRCVPSAVVMLDTPCSEVVWRLLATHCIRQFPLHFPSRASPCDITFQLESNSNAVTNNKTERKFHKFLCPFVLFRLLAVRFSVRNSACNNSAPTGQVHKKFIRIFMENEQKYSNLIS